MLICDTHTNRFRFIRSTALIGYWKSCEMTKASLKRTLWAIFSAPMSQQRGCFHIPMVKLYI